jgi:polyisoprenoid-binding protein YceI
MLRPTLSLVALLSGVLLAPVSARDGHVTYWIDPAVSEVVIHVNRTGLFSFMGHIHEVAAPVAIGTVVLVPGRLEASTVQVEFDAAALRVTGRGEPANDVPEVQQTMDSARVLDVARFPRISFASREIRVIGRDADHVRLHIAGTLTLHGVTKPATAMVSVELAPDQLRALGTLTVKQTDFGIKPVTAGAGTVRVKDEVDIAFTLVGRAAGRAGS